MDQGQYPYHNLDRWGLRELANISIELSSPLTHLSLKTESCHDDNFIVAGGTVGCHNDDLRTSCDDKIGIMTTVYTYVPWTRSSLFRLMPWRPPGPSWFIDLWILSFEKMHQPSGAWITMFSMLNSMLKGLRMVARALWRSEARRVVPWSETLHEP